MESTESKEKFNFHELKQMFPTYDEVTRHSVSTVLAHSAVESAAKYALGARIG